MRAARPLESERSFMLRAARSRLSIFPFRARTTNSTPSFASPCRVSRLPAYLPEQVGSTGPKSSCRRAMSLAGHSRSWNLAMALSLPSQSELWRTSHQTAVSGCRCRIFCGIHWPGRRITPVSSGSGPETRPARILLRNWFLHGRRLLGHEWAACSYRVSILWKQSLRRVPLIPLFSADFTMHLDSRSGWMPATHAIVRRERLAPIRDNAL